MTEAIELRDVFMFDHLSDQTLAEIAAVLEERQYANGEILFHKGDLGDEMFIVQDGAIAIFEPNASRPGQERPLRIFRAGETLGEMALIDRQPRTLSACAVQPARTFVLKGEDFRRLLNDPGMSMAVMRSLNERLRYTSDFLGEVREWMGRIASGQYEAGQFLADMQAWVKQVAEGDLPQTAEAIARYRDKTMVTLAAEFARMASQVKQREDALRREIAELKIEIDEAKRKRQVSEITDSEYFQSLKSQARELRRKRE